MLQFRPHQEKIRASTYNYKAQGWIISMGWGEQNIKRDRLRLVGPGSLAVTRGILVSFYYCAALIDMFKFSAYPRSSWCALFYSG